MIPAAQLPLPQQHLPQQLPPGRAEVHQPQKTTQETQWQDHQAEVLQVQETHQLDQQVHAALRAKEESQHS